MKNKLLYHSFTSEDFIQDASFQDWILHPDAASNGFWKKWLADHPEKQGEVERAKNFLSQIEFATHFPTDRQVQKALKKSLDQIDASRHRMRIRKNWWVSAAATLLVLVIGYGSFKYFANHRQTLLQTRYGEVKTVYLPDSSKVILNAHSTLQFVERGFLNQKSRGVWLQGEAFFEVKPGATPFIVHTEDLSVKVLGTDFDVKTNADQTRVLLKSGQVKLTFKGKKRHDLVMTPGELVAYDPHQNSLKKVSEDAEKYMAWTEGKMILDGASVKEVAKYLHRFYGYQIQIKDTAIENKRMEGTLMLDTLPNILFVMSTSLDIHIEQRGDTLIFEKNK